MSKIQPTHVQIRVRPIESWTGPKTSHLKDDRFERSGRQSLGDLRTELARIGVREAVIQADITEDDLRNDGDLRANANFRTSRIVVSFNHPKQGPMSFPAWTYRNAWANLRGVVKTLEALRDIARHGVTQNDQQYTGWRQLPGGAAIVASEFATVEDAARFLLNTAQLGERFVSDSVITNADCRRLVMREAAKKAHPDTGGSEELMRKVNAARDMIERAQKEAA